MKSPFNAKWIWNPQADYTAYNQTIIARKTFKAGRVAAATVRITADSQYRLYINGEWVNDGPSRSWPSHFQYDVIDATTYLRQGENDIVVIAKYYGIGDFHHVPQQAGLLFQLDHTAVGGRKGCVISDRSWVVAPSDGWLRNTGKISIQREPSEIFDARRATRANWKQAAELFAADRGPWKDLTPRVTALLTRRPVALRTFMSANLIEPPPWDVFWVLTAHLANPRRIEANHNASQACLLATILRATRAQTLRIESGVQILVNGKPGRDGMFPLQEGDNLLVAVSAPFGHVKELCIRPWKSATVSYINPVKRRHENPLVFIRLPEADYNADDLRWFTSPEQNREKEEIYQAIARRVEGVATVADLMQRFGNAIRCMPSSEMRFDDPHDSFMLQRIAGPAESRVQSPAALMYDNAELTTVQPATGGRDVQLTYDLGEQSCGYYEFDLMAAEGTTIDIFGVEHIRADGVLQHTENNRNGIRYIAVEGRNQFVSLIRRSQRYLYVTLRHMTGPVKIRKIGLIEATYPVHYRARFTCSDVRLEKIWEISERTLKLCMEDTFTDCPLYEQTLWVGDARNESMFAYTTFGAQDIARNGLAITGQSLERYYIAGCQVPSSWDCLLPAWSFMWGMAVWEYGFFSGDFAFVKTAWPWIMKNLKGAESRCDCKGLYADHQWNMFDWGGIVDASHMVLHNSMFIVGAINAALKCASSIKVPAADKAWLLAYRKRMVRAVNAQWDTRKRAYPDAFDSNNKPVAHTCQHTSFLSLLYDVADAKIRPHAKRNMLNPPKDMGRVSSPFAIMFFFEALEKAGCDAEILRWIYEAYVPMLEAGATTVWEVFPDSPAKPAGFPTRSHCHAWSSAPLYFMPRVLLGIRQTRAGGEAYSISPRPFGLAWADGQVVTARGVLAVRWTIEGKVMTIKVGAPDGVQWRFVTNDALKGLTVKMEKVPAPRG